MNYDGRKNATHLHHDVHEDFQFEDEVKKSLVDTKEVEDLREDLHEQFSLHEEMVKTHGSVAGKGIFFKECYDLKDDEIA